MVFVGYSAAGQTGMKNKEVRTSKPTDEANKKPLKAFSIKSLPS
jgi:hypothetical protein